MDSFASDMPLNICMHLNKRLFFFKFIIFYFYFYPQVFNMTHQESLKCLCRLCGGPVTKVNYVQKFSKDIKLALHIDVTTDSDLIHPPYMCTSCRLKLNRWRTKKNRTKIADPISLEVPSWIPHDNKCSICPSKTSTPISIVDGAKEAADQLGLISWTCNGSFVVSKFTRGGRFAERNLVINSDNTWEGAVLGKNVSCVQMCPNIPDKLRNAADACALVMALFGRPICNGNIGFDNIVDNRTTLTGKDGEVVAEIIDVPNLSSNSVTSVCKSIRHIKCQLFATSSSGVCQVCASYRVNLNSMKSRAKCSDTSNIHVNASSSTRNDFLTPEQLKDKMNDMQRERRNLINKNKSLQAQIRDLHERDATTLDEEQSQFIQEAFVNAEQVINDTSDEMAAFKLMFEQQRKAMDAKDSRQIRWHPSIIRFCIALFNKSSAAYDMLRKSPFIKLPHQSTLRQYMNFTNPQTGVNPDVLEFVANDWSFDELPDYKRNVTLIFDEVKIKAGLAYSKSSGKIIGYTDLGPVTNELEHFNAQLKSELDNESDPNIATQMLVLMARGIFSPMRIPISYFPTKNASCDQLYLCIWPTVKALTLAGLYVRAFVADGASWNKKFFIHHVHLDSRRPGETIYYTKHRYMRNGRLYFICDTPHLIKTTRNNFENSGWNLKSRNLHVSDTFINIQYVLNVDNSDALSRTRILLRICEICRTKLRGASKPKAFCRLGTRCYIGHFYFDGIKRG